MIHQVSQLRVTEVRINLPRPDETPDVLCYANLVLNGSLAIHGMRLVRLHSGAVILAMPERRRADSGWRDVVHPINESTREYLRSAVESQFRRVVERAASRQAVVA